MTAPLFLALETSSPHGSFALGRGDELPDQPACSGRAPARPGIAVRPTADEDVGRYGGVPTLLVYRKLSPDHRHAAELLPAIKETLAASGCGPRDVGVLAFSQGPGSFTGLRVAATVARMWQSATGCRVVAVPTLEVIARNVAARCSVGPPWPTLEGADTAAGRPRPTLKGEAAVISPRPPTADPDVVRYTPVAVMVDARQGRVYGGVYDFNRDGTTKLRSDTEVGVYDVASWISSLPRSCLVVGDGLKLHADAVRAAGLDALPEDFWWPDARQVLALGRELAAAGQFCQPEQIVPLYLRPPECEEVYEQRRAEAKAKRMRS